MGYSTIPPSHKFYLFRDSVNNLFYSGTSVGDPEECGAADEVFTKGRTTPLLIGSVKSNIGHSEPASGICAIIKVSITQICEICVQCQYWNKNNGCKCVF